MMLEIVLVRLNGMGGMNLAISWAGVFIYIGLQ